MGVAGATDGDNQQVWFTEADDPFIVLSGNHVRGSAPFPYAYAAEIPVRSKAHEADLDVSGAMRDATSKATGRRPPRGFHRLHRTVCARKSQA